MKTTTAHTKEVWDSGDFAGEDRRPTCRVTIQKMVASHPQYRLDETRSKQWAHSGTFLSMLFGPGDQQPRELHNVRSVKWERGVDTDVGSCTIELSNVEARGAQDPASDSELDFPGFYTPNRGTEDYFDQWGYVANTWRNWLVPDRLIRTYEGYGVDNTVAAEKDPHLYPSGTWLVDDVDISTEGTITLTCRDLGRVLLDQIIFYGLIPHHIYPLWFSPYEDRGKKQKVVGLDNNAGWVLPQYERSSNTVYAKHPELTDGGRPLVESDGTVYGHHPTDAFDVGNTYSFWLSEGYKTKGDRDAFPYVQGKLPSPVFVEGIKVDAQQGPYRLYVSLQNSSGQWLGNKRVPYRAGTVDTGANIPYVAAFSIDQGETATFKLPKRYANITKIRYTFQPAWIGYGAKYLCHAAINALYYSTDVTLEDQAGSFKYGNYGDYTDIVKWLVAWSGWFWPRAESGLTSQIYSDGTVYQYAPASVDPVLIEGRAWGDFETTGTTGIGGTKFDVDTWDKKPVMDGIAVIRDITGFDFWIDETGGVIWRLPNIFSKGCYLMPTKGGPRATRTAQLVEIDERKHLVSLNVKLSSRNVRERIFVANTAKGIGAVVDGYHPDNAGLKRFAGWTDQHFASNDECERMADLIALKQSFTYRQNQVTITANPALQPDDQVIIIERMTGEGYIHRITGISSEFDNETGRWTYTLTTNWLGNRAFTNLAWDPQKLTNATKVYLHFMGKI